MAKRANKAKPTCIMIGCDKDATISRKVKFVEQLGDYKISVDLCARHKNRFKGPGALISIDLAAFGREEILGKSKDKDKQRAVNEAFDYLRKQAKADNYEQSAILLINAAKYFAEQGDAKFLFGFYLGKLLMLSSFRELLGKKKNDADGGDASERRAQQIRSQMSLKTPYPEREHPDTSNELIDICRCGHPWFMHSESRGGQCLYCLCPSYLFEQKITKAEESELHSLLHREVTESDKKKPSKS